MPRSKRGSLAPKRGRHAKARRGGYQDGRILADDTNNLHVSGRSFASAGEMSMPSTWMVRTMDGERGVGLTLEQEARQTSQQDHSIWSQHSKLRNVPVTFRSAGISEPLKDQDDSPQAPDESQSMNSHHHETDRTASPEDVSRLSAQNDTKTINSEEITEQLKKAVINDQDNRDTESRHYFLDLTGDGTRKKAYCTPVEIPERESSPESSSSEVILFRGRNKNAPGRGPTDVKSLQVHSSPSHSKTWMTTGPARGANDTDKKAETVLEHNKTKKHGRRRKCHRQGRVHGNASDDSILDDYISNMLENGEFEDMLKSRNLGTPADGQPDSGGYSSTTPAGGIGQLPEAAPGQHHSGSEHDDEAIARLIAGQGLGLNSPVDQGELLRCDEDSSEDGWTYLDQRLLKGDEFDLMDWDRPSLQRKKGKGFKPWAIPDDCDSELEQKLQAAFNNDRLKKKQRRQQREELRALGMLGQKTMKPEDLQAKYPAGMSTAEIAEEMRTFLICKYETILFPPMDIHARKVIHELANHFKITSKSVGKGNERRPTLHRTNRTRMFVESSFEQAVARIHRRFMPRPALKGKRTPIKDTIARGSHSMTSYRDGEIVGGAAPELGVGNRGRAMLEKMGWSSGTALGASDNKGILQPVTHTMKRTKAGLG